MSKPRRSRAAWACALWVVASWSARAGEQALAVGLDALDARGRFTDGAAFCPPAGNATKDVSPGVTWSRGPEGTRSYALLMTDPDVPADLTQINRPGTVIAREAPRTTVFHWVLADIPSTLTSLSTGVESRGLVPGGKPVGPTPHGRRGANVFTTFLANVAGMGGTYGGYDGPCPPANDERIHRYIVRVLALDIPTLGLSGPFTGADVERAAAGHVLAEGRATGTYSIRAGAK